MERKPRPQGSTYLSLQYQRTNSEEDKRLLIKHIISLYTLNGFRWNNRPMNLPTLAQTLSLPVSEIMGIVSDLGTQMGSLASPENIKNTLQSIITLSTSWAIQDRGMVATQAELLMRSQGDTYKPFISSEVTKAMKVLLDANKNLIDSYKSFFTSQSSATTNILNINASEVNEDDSGYLTTDEALVLLRNRDANTLSDPNLPAKAIHNSLSEHSDLAETLFEEYRIADLEDVREWASGTDALRSPEQRHQGAPKPEGFKELKPESSHDKPFRRRAIPIIDTDELP